MSDQNSDDTMVFIILVVAAVAIGMFLWSFIGDSRWWCENWRDGHYVEATEYHGPACLGAER